MAKNILITGASGFIGSHTCVELAAAGYAVIGIDNFSNSFPEVLRRIERITGQTVPFQKLDVRDASGLRQVFQRHRIDAVIHFAGRKAVGESVAEPLMYFDNNVSGSVTLLQEMIRANVDVFVFSSSATVYGNPESLPLTENATLSVTNPYGRSKLFVEQILADLCIARPALRIGTLRYFNPIGAHSSGLIGEDPSDIPNNLVPFIAQVAIGRRAELSIFGNDYPTVDGTGVRDYIHVVDLARGHVATLNRLFAQPGSFTLNLGTGRGYSVLETIRAFEQASDCRIAYKIVPRRPGDIASCFASPDAARTLLGWQAEKTMAEMCEDHWRWQRLNPRGYLCK